jgi:hypothetical protein
MQSPTFSDSTPVAWAQLDEHPFMDGNAGGAWACGANTQWGYAQKSDAPDQHYCTSCPPCTTQRFQTRLMVRDAGPPCCTTETYSYGTTWPYEFAGGSTCPDTKSPPLFQELYNVRNYAPGDARLNTPYNPFVL